MVWSPLAGGYLTGKYSNGGDGRLKELNFPPINRQRGEPLLKILQAIADKYAATPGQIAIAWLLHQPVVTTVILGAKNVGQLNENIQATLIKLDEVDLFKLNTVSKLPGEYPGWLLDGSAVRQA